MALGSLVKTGKQGGEYRHFPLGLMMVIRVQISASPLHSTRFSPPDFLQAAAPTDANFATHWLIFSSRQQHIDLLPSCT